MATDRITNVRLAASLAYLARALESAGLPLPDGVTLELAYPYGQCGYVVTRGAAGGYAHDVPGFMDSTNGFVSKREAYDAIRQAAKTLSELHSTGRRRPLDGHPYRR